MIIAKVGNLLESIEAEKLDGIMNAANGIGPMGRGIAGAIKKYGGQEIQDDAYRVCIDCDPKAGESYFTIPGKLADQGIKGIVHAVTMKKPGGPTSIETCKSAFDSALTLAKNNNIKRIGCTALGTGVGGLDPLEIAKVMVDVAKRHTIDLVIIFMDFDSAFIDEINKH